MFSGGIEIDQWHEMCFKAYFNKHWALESDKIPVLWKNSAI